MKAAGIEKWRIPNTFRHFFATPLPENSYEIRTIQEILVHKSVKTTIINRQILNTFLSVNSPLVNIIELSNDIQRKVEKMLDK